MMFFFHFQEVPKSFKFNSTGHANSPETVVIRKTLRSTPAPKTSTGRKPLRENSLGGRQDLFKTPSKGTVSSMKSASSAKKGQSMKVRFSLHNEVQSPSGKRVSIKQTEAAVYLGSPIVLPKRYYGTPRRSRISETSMLHTSIKEESPLAHEVGTSQLLSSGSSSGRKSNTPTSASKKQTRDSYNFSVYSPSSPTLQFSQISGVSSNFARKSIDFSDFSPVSESSESPKRKRSMPSLNSTTQTVPSGRKFSFARSSVAKVKSSTSQFQSSPDNNARLSSSDLFGSSFESSDIKSTRSSRISGGSVNTSGVFKFSPNSTSRSSRNTSRVLEESVSQIPLPPSPYVSRSSIKSEKPPSSSKSNRSARSTRSGRSDVVDTPKSESWRSKSEPLSSSDSKIVASESPKGKKRISSTPKPKKSVGGVPSQSPITSPILSTGKQSFRSQSVIESMDDLHSVTSEVATISTPQSTRKKGRKGSTRMTASNSGLLSPETQLPILAVKPSTRKKQLSESVSLLTESSTLSNLSVSHDVSGRSIDQSLAQKLLDSRASSSLGHRAGSSTSVLLHDLSVSPSSSGRRKRKSSASTNSMSDVTTFDFNSVLTPKVPRGVFVSPMEENPDDLSNLSGMKIVLNPTANSPVSSYTDVRGVKRLLRTPQPSTPIASYASIEGIKRLFKQSPVANYADISGLNLLYQLSTNETNYMNVKGVRRTQNSSDVAGVEVLFESPKKSVETFTKQSPVKPVGMVPPMSRTISFVNDDDVVVDLTEPAMSGSRSRRSANQPEEIVTTSTSRTTRQMKSNTPGTNKEESVDQHVEVKTRGKRTTKVEKTVKPSTKGRNIRGGRRAQEDESDVEIIELIPEIVNSSKVKTAKGSKRKLVVHDPIEPSETVANKRTRGRNIVTEDHAPKVLQTKTPKTKQSSKLQEDKVSESPQRAELPTKRGGRKLKEDLASPLQQNDESRKGMVGKRSKPLSAESTNAHSPPKKVKRGKQAEVESADVAVNDAPQEATKPAKAVKAVATTARARRGKAATVSPVKVKTPSPIKPKGQTRKGRTLESPEIESSKHSSKGRLRKAETEVAVKEPSPVKGRRRRAQTNDIVVDDVPAPTTSRARRGKAVTVSPVKVKTPSPIKARRPAKKGKKDEAESTEVIAVTESPKQMVRGRKGKVEDIPKPLEKSKLQSPVKPKGSRRTQNKVVDPTIVLEQSPVKGRGRKAQMRVETSTKPEESTKTSRSARGRAETVAKSPKRRVEQTPVKTKPRGRRGQVEESLTLTEVPVESEAKTKGRRKQTEVDKVKTKPEPKKGPRTVKSQQSPEKTAKGRGKKKEVESTNKSPVKAVKRLKREDLAETKPSTSRREQTQQEAKNRKVQFNT